ncbi:MAG: PPC domain-containing protein [bacterium]
MEETTDTKKKARDFNHPVLRDLEKFSARELDYVVKAVLAPRSRLANPQISETVLIDVTVERGAALGDRELRIKTATGLSNPIAFQVGQLPEFCKQDARKLGTSDTIEGFLEAARLRFARGKNNSERMGAAIEAGTLEEPLVELPVLLNGQIMPGGVDRFRFRAQRGQKLVIQAKARQLIPYLADAVPGWFQATLALYDAKGNEVAFADEYRFDPDPVVFYEIPTDGEYTLEIRDALYRGREDFVYRIAVAEQPFITGIFPLGGQTGVATNAWIAGWNLPATQLPLNTQAGGDHLRRAALRQNEWPSNPVTYAVDTMREGDEVEPNDSAENAQLIAMPQIINGYISKPGDRDVFRFRGRAGDKVVAEVYARRLNTPLDSLLRLTDASGRVVAMNDDHEDKGAGLLTHHADSYLTAPLPKDGDYYLQIADTENHGGPVYGYRLRISLPQPDFALRATPSSINVSFGGTAPLNVYALRKDGFDGDIEIVLKDPVGKFTISGGRIAAGRDRSRMTLTAHGPLTQPVTLKLEGRAVIGGQTLTRPVVPAEDMMQAFAYRHLVPAQELMVAARGPARVARPLQVVGAEPLRIPVGGTAQVRIRTPRHPMLRDIKLELREPPEGVTLQEVTAIPEGVGFVLRAGSDAKAGFEDNLIVEAFTEITGGPQGGNAAKQKRRVSLGVLPAIPIQIVQQ